MSKPILLITHDFRPKTGGIARYLGLLSDFFEKDMVVVSDEHELLARFFWPRWIKSIGLLYRTRHTYRHVLVSHVLPFGTAAFCTSFFTGKPYSVILHGMDFALATQSWFKRFLTKLVLSRADHVFVNSQVLFKELRCFQKGIASIHVVYPPVVFRSKQQKLPTDKTFRLLTVSRLVERKGHRRVFEALDQLRKRHALPENFRYDVVGEGPGRASLQEAVEQLNLSRLVEFHGLVEDEQLGHFFANADLFIMPVVADSLDKEGFGMVYLEAACYGVPSVATNLSGVDEAILDGQTGLLVKDGDIGALANTLKRCMDQPGLRKQLGSQAKERALKEFTPEQQFLQIKQCLR